MSSTSSAPEPLSFSIIGKGLKLTTAEDIQPHLDALAALGPHVEEVHFGGNTLGVGACEALAENLKGLKSLRVADFADIFTGRLISEIPQALTALSDALLSCPVLHEVSFSDNAFGGRVASPMVPFLSSHPTLAVLRLANNGLGPSGGSIIAEALLANARAAMAAGRPSALRVIICGRNRLENGSAESWGKVFAAHQGLREVRLYQNGIWADGVAAIAKGLALCPDLEVFDISDNTAGKRREKGQPAKATGAMAIASALKSWPNLRELQLSDTLLNIGQGGTMVARKLGEGNNRKLEKLSLRANEMDERAVNALADAIRVLPALTTLELNENYGGAEDECYEAVVRALERHGHEDALDELDELEEFEEDVEADEDLDDDSLGGEGGPGDKYECHALAPSTTSLEEDTELAHMIEQQLEIKS